jgi:hypothetical protein
MENLYKDYYELIQAADECVNKHLLVPALVLIYTGIDTVSWMASEDVNESVGARFKNWVDAWMLVKGKLDCTAEELYAARCGVLHTLTPNSALSEKKGVRKIAYAWGTAKREMLEESIAFVSMNNRIASVHLEDLYWSFREGFADYIEHVLSNNEKREGFLLKSGQHFANFSVEQIEKLLQTNNNTYGK